MANRYKCPRFSASNSARASRGFVSPDFLFSVIPIILIVSYALIFSAQLENRTSDLLERQILFDKLVSASNYAVKIGAAQTEGSGFPEKAIHPNLVSAASFPELEKSLRERLNLKSFSISFEEGEGTCIYRLVVYEPTGEVRKLYFCGE